VPTAAHPLDDAHARLVWIVPAAVLLSFAALYGFLRLALERPAQPPVSRPATVNVIVLPAAPAQQPQPAAPPQAAPPPAAPPPEPAKPAETVPPTPLPEAIPLPKQPPPRLRPAEPRRETPPAPPPAPAAEAAPAPASPPASANSAAPAGGNMSARAIYQPPPEIPEALRRQKMDLVAVARFRVAVDGRATVELIQPTPEPVLNRALLEKLQTWRFFPAMAGGKPVASVLDIRIPISVH